MATFFEIESEFRLLTVEMQALESMSHSLPVQSFVACFDSNPEIHSALMRHAFNQLSLLFVLLLLSCADRYELVVEPETDSETTTQTFHLNFNGKISYPSGKVTKEIDIESDRFEVIKIKYTPIRKWSVNNPISDNTWGQAAIRIRIIRRAGFLFDDEVIFEQSISHFYNPGIQGLSPEREAAIRLINRDLDSGLGNGSTNNSIFWSDFNNVEFPKSFLGNSSTNYYHSLILKRSPRAVNASSLDVQATSDETGLAVDDLRRCTIIYPYSERRMNELRDY